MKKLSLFILTAFIGMLTYGQHVNDIELMDGKTLADENNLSYNTRPYTDKAVQQYKRAADPGKWGGYLKIGLGASPSHPRIFAEGSIGVIHKFAELQATALPAISDDGLMVLYSTLGYRLPVNKIFTVVLRGGYWSFWNQDDPIKWTGGNHLCYGAEINRRIHDRLELSFSWMDFRGQKYNGMKIGTGGIRYIINKKPR